MCCSQVADRWESRKDAVTGFVVEKATNGYAAALGSNYDRGKAACFLRITACPVSTRLSSAAVSCLECDPWKQYYKSLGI